MSPVAGGRLTCEERRTLSSQDDVGFCSFRSILKESFKRSVHLLILMYTSRVRQSAGVFTSCEGGHSSNLARITCITFKTAGPA